MITFVILFTIIFSETTNEMSHKQWRKIAKRERRRSIRISNAIKIKESEKRAQELLESDPNYKEWQKEQEALEIFEECESERINKLENEKWLLAEAKSQQEWRELQHKIEKARLERAQQEIRIRKEWEQEQQKIKETQERLKQIEEENLRKQRVFLEKLEMFLSGDTDTLPQEFSESRQSKPNAELCPFFAKTASCRFSDACSRNHVYPGASKILLIQNFYTHFDTDLLMEYDDRETCTEYERFFFDVVSELEKFGEIVEFKVCNNSERHLQGNAYVQYAELRNALSAYRALNARWYAGKQLSIVFCNIQSWNNAICGMYLRRKCPKGRSCNFLHIFKNPHIFNVRPLNRESRRRDKENTRNWRWSESPEPESRKCRSRISSPRRRRRSNSGNKKHKKSRSRSHSRAKKRHKEQRHK